MSLFVLRFDDITPGMDWTKFSILKQTISELKLTAIIGVVPNNCDDKLNVALSNPNFWKEIRSLRKNGWTIAQHGHTHQYVNQDSGLLKINSLSEFAGLSYQEQYSKIKIGKEILEKEEVWQPIFMAPAHSFDHTTLDALHQLDFKHLTDGYGLYPYTIRDTTLLPCLFSTPKHFGFGVYTICIHVNTMSSDQIEKMLEFIKANSARIISFEEAVNYSPKFQLLDTVTRYSLSFFLQTFRKLLK